MIKEISGSEITQAISCINYLGEYHNRVSANFRGSYPRHNLESKIEKFIGDLNSANSKAAIAYENNTAVGLIKIDIDCDDKTGVIDYLSVLPEAQKKGYGQQLMQWALSVFDDCGINRIDLHVVHGNKTVEFYKKHGFQIQSYIMERDADKAPSPWVMESERLRFRKMDENDFDTLKAIICDAETMKYYPQPYTEEGVKRWINWNKTNYEDFGFGLWAICLKETGEMIGDCGITIQHTDKQYIPEVGYHINKKYWRQGYGKEAARAVESWGFCHTSFNALYSYMNAENQPSVHTAMAMGMNEVHRYQDKDELTLVYRISRDEWAKRK